MEITGRLTSVYETESHKYVTTAPGDYAVRSCSHPGEWSSEAEAKIETMENLHRNGICIKDRISEAIDRLQETVTRGGNVCDCIGSTAISLIDLKQRRMEMRENNDYRVMLLREVKEETRTLVGSLIQLLSKQFPKK